MYIWEHLPMLCQATDRVQAATGAGWCGGSPWWPTLRLLEQGWVQHPKAITWGKGTTHHIGAGQELCRAASDTMRDYAKLLAVLRFQRRNALAKSLFFTLDSIVLSHRTSLQSRHVNC